VTQTLYKVHSVNEKKKCLVLYLSYFQFSFFFSGLFISVITY